MPYGQTIGASDIPKKLRFENWLAKLPDHEPLSWISIPGTHDCGTALGATGDTRCQSLTIPAQLVMGVRAFDLRLRLVKNVLGVYHHQESQKLSFQAVASSFHNFLAAHPHEFLVVRVRKEWDSQNSTTEFEDAFTNEVGSAGLAKMIYHANSRTEIPNVSDVRGKVVLLDNYGKLPNAIEYANPTMAIQDDYDTSDMENKYREITEAVNLARAAKDSNAWHINYTSSSTPTVDQLANAQAVNPRVTAYLKGIHGHIGTIFMNFPGFSEIAEIIGSNF
jgi:1-phosphatidylinositol phosphodiesterase